MSVNALAGTPEEDHAGGEQADRASVRPVEAAGQLARIVVAE